MTPAEQREELLDVLDEAIPRFIKDKALDLAHRADHLRRALDDAQREPEPEVAEAPGKGVAAILTALAATGSACWKAAGFRTQAQAKKRLQRAGVRGVRVGASTVRKRPQGHTPRTNRATGALASAGVDSRRADT